MSKKLTRIRLRHSRYGFMDWGERSFEEMVSQMRARAEAMKEEADAILDANESDFDVAVVRGPYVQHFVRDVLPAPQEQEGQEMGTRFTIEWGVGGVFGLPIAFTLGSFNDDGSCFGVHFGPVYFILSWRPA